MQGDKGLDMFHTFPMRGNTLIPFSELAIFNLSPMSNARTSLATIVWMKVVGVHETLHELTSNAICNVQTLVFQLVSHRLTHYDYEFQPYRTF